jgi:hypothetical protein
MYTGTYSDTMLVLILTRILVLIMARIRIHYSFCVWNLMCPLKAKILLKLSIPITKFNMPVLGKKRIFIVFQNKDNFTCFVI